VPWLKRILPLVTTILLAAVVYDGSIFYFRWRAVRNSEKAQALAEAQQAQKTLEMLGGDRLHIMNFYATPGVIRPGDSSTICYGVNGATKVRIEPPIEEVRPALNHCLKATPRADTEYKLIAEDGAGHSVTQNLFLKVQR